LFGATGGANFLSRLTAFLALMFFVCTLVLAYLGNLRPTSSGSVLETTPLTTTAPLNGQTPAAAAVPAPAGPAQQIPGK
jgi:preprotein translocase subunit SecG